MMKNCENPLRFDKVMVVSLVACFFGPPCGETIPGSRPAERVQCTTKTETETKKL